MHRSVHYAVEQPSRLAMIWLLSIFKAAVVKPPVIKSVIEEIDLSYNAKYVVRKVICFICIPMVIKLKRIYLYAT